MKTNKKILLLLSELRGIDGLIAGFKNLFPDFQTIPILFVEGEWSGKSSNNCLVLSSSSIKQFVEEYVFDDVEAIYVSFMTGDKVYFLRKAPEKIKLIWAIPGGDLYNRYLRYFGYPIIYGENRKIKNIVGKLLRKVPRREEFNYLVKRCTAVVCAYCDYDLIKKYSPTNISHPKHIYSIAYPMEKMLGPLYNQPFVNNIKTEIVIGNSASQTNNHQYILKYLKSIDRKDFNISLLLSYGDSDGKYTAKIITAYNKIFGNKVSFVTDYVTLEEFNRRLLSATHFVYGNWRQEAVGNILTAFYLGGKVYMSKRNPLLNDFRSKGFIVFCLEEINNSFYSSMSDEEKTHNRRLIDELYNEERSNVLFNSGLSSVLYD